MSEEGIIKPQMLSSGLIPTLNDRGHTTEVLDPMSERFRKFASEIDSEVLDIGCAYGVAVKPILRDGGRVCACDMDQRHLDILLHSVDPFERTRLRCVVGTLPDVDFGECSFGAILCSRVLHFLDGTDTQLSVSKMYRWLHRGGKVFLIVDSPYSGVTRNKTGPEYERKKALNDPWPGFMPEYEKYMPTGTSVRYATSFIHFMDPDILARVCEQAGFTIENKGYMARIANLERADPEGRDHATVIAVKT